MSNTQIDGTLCNCPSHKKESVLTFDGGGIRGLVSLYILQHLLMFIRESELAHDRELLEAQGLSSNLTDTDINVPLACHYFSFMFGTSTGGIIAIMLGRLRMSIEDCIEVYRDFGCHIFAKKRPLHRLGQSKYDCSRLKKKIIEIAQQRSGVNIADNPGGPSFSDRNILGEDDGIPELVARNRHVPCRVGVFAVQTDSGNGKTQKLHLFRSYWNPTPHGRQAWKLYLNLANQQEALIWEVARATSAAPTYFRSILVNNSDYIDGGVMANNPSEHAWAEVRSMHQNHPSGKCQNNASEGGIKLLVSIGTGKRAEQRIWSGKGPISRLQQLVALLKRGLQDMTDPERTHQKMDDLLRGRNIYHRFNVDAGLENMKLDECKIHTFQKIQADVGSYVMSPVVRTRLKKLAEQLVNHRRSKCRLGHESFRDLCNPGPLRRPYDPRFREDNDNHERTGNTEGNQRRAAELGSTTPVHEMQPRTPINSQPPIPDEARLMHTTSHSPYHSQPRSPVPNMSQRSQMPSQDVASQPQSPVTGQRIYDTPQMGFSQENPPSSLHGHVRDTSRSADGRGLGILTENHHQNHEEDHEENHDVSPET